MTAGIREQIQRIKNLRAEDKLTVEGLRKKEKEFTNYKTENDPKLEAYETLRENLNPALSGKATVETLSVIRDGLPDGTTAKEGLKATIPRVNGTFKLIIEKKKELETANKNLEAILTPLNTDRSALTGADLLKELNTALPEGSAARIDMTRAIQTLTGNIAKLEHYRDNESYSKENFKWLDLPIPDTMSPGEAITNIYNNIPDGEEFSALRTHLGKYIAIAETASDAAAKYKGLKNKSIQLSKDNAYLGGKIKTDAQALGVSASLLEGADEQLAEAKKENERLFNENEKSKSDFGIYKAQLNPEIDPNLTGLKKLTALVRGLPKGLDIRNTIGTGLKEAVTEIKDRRTKDGAVVKALRKGVNPDLSDVTGIEAITAIYHALPDGSAKLGLETAAETIRGHMIKSKEYQEAIKNWVNKDYSVIKDDAERMRVFVEEAPAELKDFANQYKDLKEVFQNTSDANTKKAGDIKAFETLATGIKNWAENELSDELPEFTNENVVLNSAAVMLTDVIQNVYARLQNSQETTNASYNNLQEQLNFIECGADDLDDNAPIEEVVEYFKNKLNGFVEKAPAESKHLADAITRAHMVGIKTVSELATANEKLGSEYYEIQDQNEELQSNLQEKTVALSTAEGNNTLINLELEEKNANLHTSGVLLRAGIQEVMANRSKIADLQKDIRLITGDLYESCENEQFSYEKHEELASELGRVKDWLDTEYSEKGVDLLSKIHDAIPEEFSALKSSLYGALQSAAEEYDSAINDITELEGKLDQYKETMREKDAATEELVTVTDQLRARLDTRKAYADRVRERADRSIELAERAREAYASGDFTALDEIVTQVAGSINPPLAVEESKITRPRIVVGAPRNQILHWDTLGSNPLRNKEPREFGMGESYLRIDENGTAEELVRVE